jgi:integrase
MAKRRDHGDGAIDERKHHPDGTVTYRLRYRLDGRRFTCTVRGTKADAKKELRRLIRSGDAGEHVAPDKLTVADWIDRWLALKEPNVKTRTFEHYKGVLKNHVVPALGARKLQQLSGTMIDDFYAELRKKLAPRTMGVVHVILKACLETSTKKKLLSANPGDDAERPETDDEEVGVALDEDQLAALVAGFRGTSIYVFVATLAFTGMRRNEALALRWFDIDLDTGMISVTRNVEKSKMYGLRIVTPKTARSVRKFKIDDGLVRLLRSERERHLRLQAGIPDGVGVDTSLIRLPADALVFPAMPGTDLTAIRSPGSVSKMFAEHVEKLGFDVRLHDLRGSHETILLDKGVALHTVAARCGHSPTMLLKVYAKRTKKSDTTAANVIGTLTKGLL